MLFRTAAGPGDIVLDLFGGSGSTLVAAEQTGRICYTSEIDPVYCDVIVARAIAQAGGDKGVFLLRDSVKKSHADVAGGMDHDDLY